MNMEYFVYGIETIYIYNVLTIHVHKS